jgi:hypothetical protein
MNAAQWKVYEGQPVWYMCLWYGHYLLGRLRHVKKTHALVEFPEAGGLWNVKLRFLKPVRMEAEMHVNPE